MGIQCCLNNREGHEEIQGAAAAKKLVIRDWERTLYSGIGGVSVYERVAPDTWTPPRIQRIDVREISATPSRTPILLRGVFSKSEAAALCKAMPTEGYMFQTAEEVSKMYRSRVVDRFNSFDEPLAQLIHARISEYLPAEIDGGRLYGVCPLWRFLHYTKGGHQGPHLDGREPREPAHDEATGQFVQSRLSCQMYLSDQGEDFTGGSMNFLRITGRDAEQRFTFETKYELKPAAGDALISYCEEPTYRLKEVKQMSQQGHDEYELWHEGADVLSGHKYCLRTVISYSFPTRARALDAKNVKWLTREERDALDSTAQSKI